MNKTTVIFQIVLDYTTFYGDNPPKDRISLIKHISKKNILCELTGLNYRLKQKHQFFADITSESQIRELKYFTKDYDLFIEYYKIFDKYNNQKNKCANIFNRQACLFAIEEIINSNEINNIEDFKLDKIEYWESIVKYLLCINHEITQFKEEEFNEQMSFESLNSKILPLNEQLVENSQIHLLYRGYSLLSYFLNRTEYAIELEKYFKETYGIEPHKFIFHILNILIGNKNKDNTLDYFYFVPEEHEDIFRKLSRYFPNKDTHKLITIKKSPFINISKQKYLLVDISFLVEKSYAHFLNDFWFDWIRKIADDRGKSKFTIEHYKSQFGYFFEEYITQIFDSSFKNYKHSKLLMFNQLKIKSKNGVIEIADIYLRYGKRILLGQVKAGSIYDKEKFGGNLELLYKNNRDKFFENFGVDQIVKSIKNLDEFIQELDPKFPKNHLHEIFPCIIVNERVFQTILMPNIFNKRFEELMINFQNKKIKINPLTVIHVSDCEKLEDLLKDNPGKIWELIKLNHQNRNFAPPFWKIVNGNTSIEPPKRVLDLYLSLIDKYSPT